MIRKNPSGDLPQIAESAYVDRTAIICGKVVIGENVFVGQAVAERQQVDANALTAWHRGKLIFNRKPLQDVLAELERYQYGRIVLPDATLGAMQISGVFDLNDPQNLLHTLEQRYGLNITYLPFVAWVH